MNTLSRAAARTLFTAVAALLVIPAASPLAAAAPTPDSGTTVPAPAPIDHSALPPAGRPAPPEPTVQTLECAPFGLSQDSRLALGRPGGLDSPLAHLTRELRPLATGAGTRIAVIDTGVSPHPRLPRLRPGGDLVARGDGLEDCDGHGTLVAGLIAAAPGPDGVSGIAPDATVVSYRQTSAHYGVRRDRPGGGRGGPGGAVPPPTPPGAPVGGGYGDLGTLAAAIRTAADDDVDVISISLVACRPVSAQVDESALGAALYHAVEVRDVVVVVAAGNIGPTCPDQNPTVPGATGPTATLVTPAWYADLVLTVGAIDAAGAPADYSIAGPWVDVAAPGDDVLSLDPRGDGLVDRTIGRDGSTAPIRGTSFATPLVAATALLVRERHPDLPARAVRDRIRATARQSTTGQDPRLGAGIVDPLAALGAAPAPPGDATGAAPAPGPGGDTGTGLTSTGTRGASSAGIAAPAPAPTPDHGSGRRLALVLGVVVGAATLLAAGLGLRRHRPAPRG